MVKISHKGNFSKTKNYLVHAKSAVGKINLEEFGKAGVSALSSATPLDSGNTASLWYYTISNTNSHYQISFGNSNIVDNVPIAIILECGHGTKNGGWVQGRNYINPAIQPIFDKLAEGAWKEVTNK